MSYLRLSVRHLCNEIWSMVGLPLRHQSIYMLSLALNTEHIIDGIIFPSLRDKLILRRGECGMSTAAVFTAEPPFRPLL